MLPLIFDYRRHEDLNLVMAINNLIQGALFKLTIVYSLPFFIFPPPSHILHANKNNHGETWEKGGKGMFKIAIDGPAAAGKSTLAKKLVEMIKEEFVYIDTGAMYRAIGYCALQNNVHPEDEFAVTELCSRHSIRFAKAEDSAQIVLLDGEDISSEIRTEQVSMAASTVSKIGRVREILTNMQREIAETNNVVMDGRDIGTVVLPNAEVKIFLTAEAPVRASRRWKDLRKNDMDAVYDEVLADLIKRDKQDSEREIAPLTVADDAFVIDSTRMSIEQVLDETIRIINSLKVKN